MGERAEIFVSIQCTFSGPPQSSSASTWCHFTERGLKRKIVPIEDASRGAGWRIPRRKNRIPVDELVQNERQQMLHRRAHLGAFGFEDFWAEPPKLFDQHAETEELAGREHVGPARD